MTRSHSFAKCEILWQKSASHDSQSYNKWFSFEDRKVQLYEVQPTTAGPCHLCAYWAPLAAWSSSLASLYLNNLVKAHTSLVVRSHQSRLSSHLTPHWWDNLPSTDGPQVSLTLIFRGHLLFQHRLYFPSSLILLLTYQVDGIVASIIFLDFMLFCYTGVALDIWTCAKWLNK